MIPPRRSFSDRAMPARFLALALLIAASVTLAGPAAAQDAADFVVRLNRLEGQVRQMSGHIEQLQFENRQLKDQLRKFEEDIEFRFQESAGGRGAAPRLASPPAASPESGSRSEAALPQAARPGGEPHRARRRIPGSGIRCPPRTSAAGP